MRKTLLVIIFQEFDDAVSVAAEYKVIKWFCCFLFYIIQKPLPLFSWYFFNRSIIDDSASLLKSCDVYLQVNQ